MNHSCSPNVIVTYKGTVAEVRAVQEINPGDEVRKHLEPEMFFTRTRLVDEETDVLSVSFRPCGSQTFLSLSVSVSVDL